MIPEVLTDLNFWHTVVLATPALAAILFRIRNDIHILSAEEGRGKGIEAVLIEKSKDGSQFLEIGRDGEVIIQRPGSRDVQDLLIRDGSIQVGNRFRTPVSTETTPIMDGVEAILEPEKP